jgi:hypothetical protein
MEGNIFEVDRDPNGDVVLRFKSPKGLGMSASTMEHLLAAQREALLALRSMLDSALEVTEDLERSKQKKKPRTNIKVQ